MSDAKRPHFSMLRTFALADLVTMVNAASGTGAIFCCVRYAVDHDPRFVIAALVLLPVALIADVADGAVARWRRKHSPIGADLDSLADVVSFGVAPAVLGFTLGLDGGWDAAILVYFVACGISRLARYNVTAASLSDSATGKVKYYEGTPIPTSLALVLVLGIAWGTGAVHESIWGGVLELGLRLHPLSLIYLVSGSAMISATLRIPKP